MLDESLKDKLCTIEAVQTPSMAIVNVSGLSKTFRVADKQPGLGGTLRHFLQRRHRLVPAVQDINIAIEPGEMLGSSGRMVPARPPP